MLRWAASRHLSRVCIHVITDGRDTAPNSAPLFLARIRSQIEAAGVGEITTICGRYWAMDRDNNWERTERAYRLLTEASPIHPESAEELLDASYAGNVTDEFMEPMRLAPGLIAPGDGVICFNFRPDRVRQLIRALVLPSFEPFDRDAIVPLHVVTFTQYEKGLPVSVAFPPESLDGLLGQVVSENGLRQLRTAETEKYPHVTYFMNGGIEKSFPGEDRQLVPSPKVATYDQSPQMSAKQLTDSCIAAINKGIYSLVVINYANPDMVGHTGILEAAKEAIRVVDACVGRLMEATNRMGGSLLITADHGNAELMRSPEGRPWTAHTTNPVPVILVEGEKRKVPGHGTDVKMRPGGGLADIAPTVLELLDLPKPALMTGVSLIEPPDQEILSLSCQFLPSEPSPNHHRSDPPLPTSAMLRSILSWLWMSSGVLLIISVLLHSPKGDGMGGLASSGGSMFTSARSAEATLNRITWSLTGDLSGPGGHPHRWLAGMSMATENHDDSPLDPADAYPQKCHRRTRWGASVLLWGP